jgi:hypothetical protein
MFAWLKNLHWIYKVGIAFSIAYALNAGINEYNEIIRAANNFADADLRTCMGAKETGCEIIRAKNFALFTENMSARLLVAAIAPIPLFWIFGTTAIYLLKILRSGFKTEISWHQYNIPKRIMTAICLLFFFAALAFVYTWIEALQKGKKVPVSMAHTYSLFKYPETSPNYVSVMGTWQPDREPKKMSWDFLQTSTISCSKATSICHQAIASISNNTNLMRSGLEEYRILNWTENNIMFAKEAMCFNHIFTIDLVTGKTNSIIKNTGEKQCEPVEEVSFSMVNGFDVYWKKYSEAK